MGASQSTALQRGEELLSRLAGPASIPFADEFWGELFNVLDMHPPMISLDPEVVHARLSPHCQQLLVCNPLSHNFQVLVLHTVGLIQDACEARSRNAAANALHSINAVIHLAAESGNGSSLLASLFTITPNLPIPQQLVDPGTSQLLRLLVRRALTALLQISSRGPGAVVVTEVLHLLILLLAATTLGAPARGPPGSHPGLEGLYGTQQAVARKLVCRIMALHTSRPPPAPELEPLAAAVGRSSGGASVGGTMSSVASLASTVLWLPATALSSMVSTVSGGGSGGSGASGTASTATGLTLSAGERLPPSPVGDLSTLLLLLLLNAPDQPPATYNPFRRALADLRNVASSQEERATAAVTLALATLDDGAGGAGQRASSGGLDDSALYQLPTSSFPALYQSLAKGLGAPAVLLPDPTATRDPDVGFWRQGPLSGPSGPAGPVSTGAEEALLLCYAMLSGCPAFKEFVLAHPEPDVLLIPLLRLLYEVSPLQQPHLLFMAQVVLLILSQEPSWARRLHGIHLPYGLAWCKEHPAKGLSLGSLLVIVLVRTVSLCWVQGMSNDLIAPNNAVAALANLAPYCTHLHPRAVQRLMALLLGLARRYQKLAAVLNTPVPLTVALAGGQPGSDTMSPATAAQLSLAEEYLRLVLEVVSLALNGPAPGDDSDRSASVAAINSGRGMAHSSHLASNLELVYGLLQQQETVASLTAHPRLGELATNLQLVIDFFNYRLDAALRVGGGTKPSADAGLPVTQQGTSSGGASAGSGGSSAGGGNTWSSPAQVLQVLMQSVADWRPDRLKQFPQLRFRYEEEAEPDMFFMPYVWRLVLQRCGSIVWDEQQQAAAITGPGFGGQGPPSPGGELPDDDLLA